MAVQSTLAGESKNRCAERDEKEALDRLTAALRLWLEKFLQQLRGVVVAPRSIRFDPAHRKLVAAYLRRHTTGRALSPAQVEILRNIPFY
ncbi:hypothetical protein EMMF5_006245, partial [Cystobasidiomycetes sp. EMM_F5]